jgi:iron complex outermembrane recepter protein
MKSMLASRIVRDGYRHLVWLSVALAAMLFATAWAPVVLAQGTATTTAAATAATDDSQLEEVVVTGSLIRRPAAETTEAVTVLSVSSLKDQGVQTVEQALQMLTSNNPSMNIASSVGTFSGGGTYANLRGLGDGRTLVLLDGERLADNANTGDAVDLSGIPFSAIESIEVLREGASAEYGSDAIAGVINFITKKNYQGLEVQGTFDKPQESGGTSQALNVTFGHGDLKSDGYNILITGSYTKQNDLTASQRSFSSYGFYPGLGYSSTNDPGTWPASVKSYDPSTGMYDNFYQSGYPACTGNPQLTTYLGNCAYRYSAATELLPQTQEFSGLASITKTLPGNNQIQLQLLESRTEVLAFSGPMFYEGPMSPSSPYYPTAGQLTCITAYSQDCTQTVDLNDPAHPINAVWTDPNNNRYTGNINTEQRAVLTFSGHNGGWDYSAAANYSENDNNNQNVSGYPDESMLFPGGTLSNLINPFGPQSAAGQALINSSYKSGTYSLGEDRRWSADGHVSHPLFTLFSAPDPVTLAIGADVEGEHFQEGTTPYNLLVQAADGLSTSSVSGSRTTQAAFAELDVPITRQIDVDISDREDHYSDFGSSNNGKLAVSYSPSSFIKFRGTASTGFRAPTLFSLYSSSFVAASSSGTMGAGNPFCSPGHYTVEWSEAVCNTQGLGLFGGNPNLTPEKSKNYDLGVILSPVDNLGVTIDYYRIVLTNTIGSVPYTAIYGDPTLFANLIHLNNAGTLTPTIQESTACTPSYTLPTCGYIILGNTNTGQESTNGFDISVQYTQHTGIGTFKEDLEGNLVTQFLVQQYTGGPELNLDGDYNELLPAFKWQHTLRVDWASPEGMWTAGLTNRYYSSYIDEYGTGPTNGGPLRTVGAYSLFNGDVSVKPIQNLTVLFGVKNILNTSPPFTNAYQNNFAAGYNAIVADPLLRNFYLNVSYKFF